MAPLAFWSADNRLKHTTCNAWLGHWPEAESTRATRLLGTCDKKHRCTCSVDAWPRFSHASLSLGGEKTQDGVARFRGYAAWEEASRAAQELADAEAAVPAAAHLPGAQEVVQHHDVRVIRADTIQAQWVHPKVHLGQHAHRPRVILLCATQHLCEQRPKLCCSCPVRHTHKSAAPGDLACKLACGWRGVNSWTNTTMALQLYRVLIGGLTAASRQCCIR